MRLDSRRSDFVVESKNILIKKRSRLKTKFGAVFFLWISRNNTVKAGPKDGPFSGLILTGFKNPARIEICRMGDFRYLAKGERFFIYLDRISFRIKARYDKAKQIRVAASRPVVWGQTSIRLWPIDSGLGIVP